MTWSRPSVYKSYLQTPQQARALMAARKGPSQSAQGQFNTLDSHSSMIIGDDLHSSGTIIDVIKTCSYLQRVCTIDLQCYVIT